MNTRRMSQITYVKGLCESCKGHGWLMSENDTHGLQIEKCDSCNRFKDDQAALVYVADQADAASELLAALKLVYACQDFDFGDTPWLETQVQRAIAQAEKKEFTQ